MRATWLIVLLAGCTSLPSPADDLTTSPDVMVAADAQDCPLTYPDGSPMPCAIQEFVAATADAPPSLLEGWRCTNSWTEDGLTMQELMHADGRIGFAWDWQRWKEDGIAFQRLGWYTGVEQGMSYHIPYQPTGFFVMPEHPGRTGMVELQYTVRLMRVHASIDGGWVQDPPDATLLLSHVGGDWWWAYRFDWEGGPYYVSTMHEDMEEGQLGKWQGSNWQGRIAGRDVIIDSMGNGIKYVGVDLSRRAASADGECVPLPL